MGVIQCATCGFHVESKTTTCPNCHGDPRVRGSARLQRGARVRPDAGAGEATDIGGVTVGRRVMATLLSVVVPGTGLFLRHRTKAGLIVLLACLALIVPSVAIIASTWNDETMSSGGVVAVLLLCVALGPYVYGIIASAQPGLRLARVVAADGPGDGAIVTLHRGGDYTLDAYEVYLDDEEVGGVRGNSILEITVAPGRHTLAIGARGERGPAVELEAHPGRDLTFECGQRVAVDDAAAALIDTAVSQLVYGHGATSAATLWLRPGDGPQ